MTANVKRYKNRKLYFVEESKYISSKRLVELVQAGTDVHIWEVETGKNITGEFLIRALMEISSEQFNAPEVKRLAVQIIRSGGFGSFSKQLS
jgi:polyhydroxyalkanoate synthesis regulator protein